MSYYPDLSSSLSERHQEQRLLGRATLIVANTVEQYRNGMTMLGACAARAGLISVIRALSAPPDRFGGAPKLASVRPAVRANASS